MTELILKYGAFFSGLVMLFLAIWLSFSYKRTKNIPVGYLALFFWIKTTFISVLFLSMLGPLRESTRILLANISFSILSFSLIPLIMFACHLWFSRYKKILVGTGLSITTLAVIIGFLVMPSHYDPTQMGISKFTGIYIFLSHLVVMVATGVAIFVLGVRSSDKRIALRSSLLGLGMVGAALSGCLQTILPQHILLLRTILDISHISMGAGVLVRPSRG